VVFRREDDRGWRIEGPGKEGTDRRDIARAEDGGGREERSSRFRVADVFALSDALSDSASEFEP
jgi:hypothetical protein